MAQIEAYTGRDEASIRRLVAEESFPAALVRNRWQAVVKDIDEWYRNKHRKKDPPAKQASHR